MNISASVCALALLTPAPPGGSSVTYKGFVNEPLGQASLTVDGNDRLIVSNISASGQDGVGIDYSEFFEIELDLPDAGLGTDGAYIELKAIGFINGLPDQILQTARIEDLGSEYGLMIDTSGLGSTSVSVVSSGGDYLIEQVDYLPPPPANHAVATFASGDVRWAMLGVGGASVFQSVRFDTFVPVSLPDGPPGNVGFPTTVEWTATGGPQIAGSAERIEIRASGLDPLIIDDEDASYDCLASIFPPFFSYCTPKTSSAGCVATLTGTTDPEGTCTPTSGNGHYSVVASGLQGFHNGILFFSVSGNAAIPFSGGTLCMFPPLARGPVMNSMGTSPTSCDGTFAQVVDDGGPWDPGPGGDVWVQAWYRDPQNGPGNLGTALSSALQLGFNNF